MDGSWAVRTVVGAKGTVAGCRYREGGELPDGSRRPRPPPRAAEAERGRETKPDERDHGLLTLWAADCAEHVLPYFEEKHPKDGRPRNAVEAGRAWVRGEIATGEARAAAFAAHAAARAADGAAARAAGHAAASAHVAGHAAHAANYALTATTDATIPADSAARERDWQYRRLPEHLRPVAFVARGDN